MHFYCLYGTCSREHFTDVSTDAIAEHVMTKCYIFLYNSTTEKL